MNLILYYFLRPHYGPRFMIDRKLFYEREDIINLLQLLSILHAIIEIAIESAVIAV